MEHPTPSRTGQQAGEAAREAGAAAKQKTLSLVDEQKHAAAEQMHGLADAIRATADRLQDSSSGALAGHLERTAERIENASRSLREEDMGALLKRAEEFARRQPTAFVGTSLLLGFALARFLKSSSERGSTSSRATDQARLPSPATATPESSPTPGPMGAGYRPVMGPTT